MGTKKPKPTNFDREVASIVQSMLQCKLRGAIGRVVMVEGVNEVQYVWHDKNLERQYYELEEQLNGLARRKLG